MIATILSWVGGLVLGFAALVALAHGLMAWKHARSRGVPPAAGQRWRTPSHGTYEVAAVEAHWIRLKCSVGNIKDVPVPVAREDWGLWVRHRRAWLGAKERGVRRPA